MIFLSVLWRKILWEIQMKREKELGLYFDCSIIGREITYKIIGFNTITESWRRGNTNERYQDNNERLDVKAEWWVGSEWVKLLSADLLKESWVYAHEGKLQLLVCPAAVAEQSRSLLLKKGRTRNVFCFCTFLQQHWQCFSLVNEKNCPDRQKESALHCFILEKILTFKKYIDTVTSIFKNTRQSASLINSVRGISFMFQNWDNSLI